MQLRRWVLLLLLSPAMANAGGSPYTLRWSVDGPLAGAAAGFGALSLGLRSSTAPLTPEEIALLSADDINALDRGTVTNRSEGAATASDVLGLAILASPLLLLADDAVRADAGTVGAMYLEVLALSAVIPPAVKELTHRARPYVYNPAVPLDEKTTPEAHRSFFSQHATFAFSSAVFLSTVYGDFNPDSKWTPYVWAGSLAAAGAVAWLRVEAGQHFPTDVIAGAAVGAAIGWLVPALHRTVDDGLSSTAVPRAGGFTLAIRYSF